VIDPPDSLPPLLRRRAAVFVSAMRNGAPRACMGTLYPAEPDAAHEIIASAVAAAGRDHRFPPVKPSELSGLTLIVSIVEPPHPIAEAEIASLDPTREGLAARYNGRFGVVLSRETTRTDRMTAWARTRAGAPAGRRVGYFRLRDVRFVENEPRPHH
jgi:AMMECR1 domain-containing protein